MATTFVNDGSNASLTPVGDSIFAAFTSATNTAATEVNTAINASSLNPGDPTTMIKMQVALANYSLALSVQSSVIKSLEETAKSLTQKL